VTRSISHDVRERRKQFGYRIARAIAMVAAVSSLTIICLMVFNHIQYYATDPLNSVALQSLVEEHNQGKSDAELQAQIRALDLLARQAFFNSLAFSRRGAILLVIGLGILVAALKTMVTLAEQAPDPRTFGDAGGPLHRLALTRWMVSLTGALVVAVVFALIAAYRSAVPDAGGRNEAAAAQPALGTFPPWEEVARNWPAFRGPGGLGRTDSTGLPTEWSVETGENIRWTAAVPRPGFSSPVVWGDRLFVTGADEGGRELYCYDADRGELLWRRDVMNLPSAASDVPDLDEETGLAPLTPATDGTHVAAIFATGELVCCDFDGNVAWSANLGLPLNSFGHASSLMVFEDLLLVQLDQDEGGGQLTAYRMATGDVVWEREREVGVAWSTPAVVATGGNPVLLLSGSPLASAFEPRTGRPLWDVECMDGEVAPSPAYAGGLAFFAVEYGQLTAIDVLTGETRWSTTGDLPDVASPVAVGNCLFALTNAGTITCFDVNTGEVIWSQENDEGFYASPIVAGGLLYLVDFSGGVDILEAGRTYRRVSRQVLGERSVCTPAVARGNLYFRGNRNLVCVGKDDV